MKATTRMAFLPLLAGAGQKDLKRINQLINEAVRNLFEG